MTLKRSQNVGAMRILILLSLFTVLWSCNSDSRLEKEIAAIPMDVSIVRFDKVFAEATVDELPGLKSEYPLLFPKTYPDSVWVAKMQDSIQLQLESEVEKVFPDSDELETTLEGLFQHIEYYFPQFQPPEVITATSDVDYRNKVLISEGICLIGLDNYLGSEHPFYISIPKYVSKNMSKGQIAQDVAQMYTREFIARPRQRTLLALMVYYGKELYLKDLWLPNTTDADKMGYTEDEMRWAIENEADIWRYFIENELLFDTDSKLPPRFINPAPFSKFYLEIDNESPGMIGRYMGWQIVKAYMKNNPVNLQQLLIQDAETIYKESKFKPRK